MADKDKIEVIRKPAPNKAYNAAPATKEQSTVEIGGQKGPEPTRYGDWEKNGRCSDF